MHGATVKIKVICYSSVDYLTFMVLEPAEVCGLGYSFCFRNCVEGGEIRDTDLARGWALWGSNRGSGKMF